VLPVRILVADGFPVIRVGLRSVIEVKPTWKVVAEAVDGSEAVRLAVETRPDIAILGHRLPALNGIQATSKIRELAAETKTLIFATGANEPDVRAALNSGARGYLLKSDGNYQLVAAIEALVQHKPFFSEMVSQQSLPNQVHGDGPLLTRRERDVVQLIAEGQSNKEIAHRLGIVVRTVESRRLTIMRKLKLSSVAALVRYAVRNAIVNW
jgi:DNA-binding NarL/FixJ family response regulator